MKKKFILFSLFALLTSVAFLVSNKANATTQGLRILACIEEDANGNVISVGNGCGDGTSNCIENPCN